MYLFWLMCTLSSLLSPLSSLLSLFSPLSSPLSPPLSPPSSFLTTFRYQTACIAISSPMTLRNSRTLRTLRNSRTSKTLRISKNSRSLGFQGLQWFQGLQGRQGPINLQGVHGDDLETSLFFASACSLFFFCFFCFAWVVGWSSAWQSPPYGAWKCTRAGTASSAIEKKKKENILGITLVPGLARGTGGAKPP